jgi:ATP synthase protein I
MGAIRVVLRWMLCATLAAALIAWVGSGHHGAVSALLGGFINILAGAIFAWLAARGNTRTAGRILRTAIRAEVSKIVLIVCLLGLVLGHYHHIVPLAFFGTFFLTVLLFAAAILIRDS